MRLNLSENEAHSDHKHFLDFPQQSRGIQHQIAHRRQLLEKPPFLNRGMLDPKRILAQSQLKRPSNRCSGVPSICGSKVACPIRKKTMLSAKAGVGIGRSIGHREELRNPSTDCSNRADKAPFMGLDISSTWKQLGLPKPTGMPYGHKPLTVP